MLSAFAEHESRQTQDAMAVPDVQRKPCAAVRPATQADFEEIMRIEGACFPGELAYTRDEMGMLLSSPDSATFVEEADGALSGYVTAVFEPGSRTAGIETIGVAPHAQGRGVGKRLLSAAEACMAQRGARTSRLEVSTGNRVAIAMYSRAGYGICGELHDYYTLEHHGTRKAYRMEKGLPGGE